MKKPLPQFQQAQSGRFKVAIGQIVALLFMLTTISCQSLLTPPRAVTATAQAQVTPTHTRGPIILPAPPGTAVPEAPIDQPVIGSHSSISVWINETSSEHERMLNEMMADFSQANQIDVELKLVAPSLLPKLMETAVLSDAISLPDIVLHPLEYTMGWAERGILDAVATDEIITEIGRETFNPEALALVTQDGLAAAIPSDGYQQLFVYRSDWVGEFDLSPPDNYDAILAMAQTISNTESLISGFVIPTEANLITTHQAFEQIAAANGCHLIDEKGKVLILEPACQEALDFYFSIVHNFSPSGVQTDTSVQNAYLADRTGLIISSPSILPVLAGLDNGALPTCAQCTADPRYLARNSGILTHISGSGSLARPANLGEVTYLGITSAADQEAVAAFARYWFNEGYAGWLAVETERKVPMRWGTAEQPRQYIDAWGTQPLTGDGPSLSQLYGETVVAQLRDSVAVSDRWGLAQGHGELVTALYEELAISIVLQEMLSGYFNPGQTLVEAYSRIIDLIPNYAYDRESNTGE